MMFLHIKCRAEKGNLGVPLLPGQGCSFYSFKTNTYKLNFMESPAGIKVSIAHSLALLRFMCVCARWRILNSWLLGYSDFHDIVSGCHIPGLSVYLLVCHLLFLVYLPFTVSQSCWYGPISKPFENLRLVMLSCNFQGCVTNLCGIFLAMQYICEKLNHFNFLLTIFSTKSMSWYFTSSIKCASFHLTNPLSVLGHFFSMAVVEQIDIQHLFLQNCTWSLTLPSWCSLF